MLQLGWEGIDMRQDRHATPFALELLKEHRNGKSVEELSRETGIPAERIEMRLAAAAAFLKRTSEGGPISA
jgi:hypothetical protein